MEHGFKWNFIDKKGTFVCENAREVNQLYFPICNEAGMKASVTPCLNGDAKKNQNEFLYLPVSVEDLHNNRSGRNSWVYTKEQGAFSVVGNSARQRAEHCFKDEEKWNKIECGLLYHSLYYTIPELKLNCIFTTFCPANEDVVEINRVILENYGSEILEFVPTAAFPIFGRSADNLRDHRHATSLMQRITLEENGIVVKPTIHHDERGHEPNDTSYFVYGSDESGQAAVEMFPTVEEFIGKGGTLDWPGTVVENSIPEHDMTYRKDGMECIGAMRFAKVRLAPGEKKEYIICAGITEKENFNKEFEKYNSKEKVEAAWKQNEEHWNGEADKIKFQGNSDKFDGWLRWVSIQPALRKIYGCSFLPYHDYGRGGRGWRDLWQDYLTLLLQNPMRVRSVFVHNMKGVRLDGSNATIILDGEGNFQADRNKISRVWMDHGVWPLFTLLLYMNQTGDISILDEEVSYWKDAQIERAKRIDTNWKKEDGNSQKTKDGECYTGTILEHLLLENLICSLNIGEHGNIKLEDGDWNDQLDMAPDKGETIPFTAFYGKNICDIADLLEIQIEKEDRKTISVFEEMEILLEGLKEKEPQKEVEVLKKYYEHIRFGISGKKKKIPVLELKDMLRWKGKQLLQQVRENEWIELSSKEGFFNGYYNNDGNAVDGILGDGKLRFGLTAQTFSIMSGAATDEQVQKTIHAVNNYLPDKNTGGIRLTLPLGDNTWNFGRGFALIYGEKENGGMFSHMTTMYAYALYSRGYAREGYQIIKSIYELSTNTQIAQIYPGVPEYISSRGRGMYSYVTGAGSWTIFLMLTQVYGIRGQLGDLLIEPKLVKEQYDSGEVLTVDTLFAEKEVCVSFYNRKHLDYGEYQLGELSINGEVWKNQINSTSVVLHQAELEEKLIAGRKNQICIELVERKG